MALNPADRAFSDDDLRRMFGGTLPRRKQVAYFLDENFMGNEAVEFMRDEDVRVITVADRGLAGVDSDYLILSEARKLGCVTVTRDAGFDLLHQRIVSHRDLAHAGIIIVNDRLTDVQAVNVLLRVAEKWLDYPEDMTRRLFSYG